MSEPELKYRGMTVNERLSVAGLLHDWDAAVLSGDRQAAIDILCTVELTPESSAGTVDAVSANPVKFGYPIRSKE